MMMTWKLVSWSSQTQEPPKDEKPRDSEKHSDQQCHLSGDGSTEHQGGDHSDHKKSQGRSRSKSRSKSPCGFAVLPRATGFTLATGLMPMTGVRIETADQFMAHSVVMIATGTVTVKADIMMTDIMTITTANIMTGVTSGDHVGVLQVSFQTALGLMTAVQTTGGTDINEVTLVSETGETVVALLAIDMMGTTVMIVVIGPHLQTTGTIARTALS